MFFNGKQLVLDDFEPQVLEAFDDLAAVTRAMNATLCRKALPEHFLIALLSGVKNAVSREFQVKALDPASAAEIVRKQIMGKDLVTHDTLTTDTLSPAAQSMFEAFTHAWQDKGAPGGQFNLFAAEVLRACGHRTTTILSHGGVDLRELAQRLAATAGPADVGGIEVPSGRGAFDADGRLILESFDPAVRLIIERIESEGSSLGLEFIGPPLLLYAMLSIEDGILEQALRAQGASPRGLQQALLLMLRSLGRKKLSELPVRAATMQDSVRQAFENAARQADERQTELIGAPHLLAAIIDTDRLITAGLLREHDVKGNDLVDYAYRYYKPVQRDEDCFRLPPADEIIHSMRDRVKGQDHAIDSLRPMLRRICFGYRRPNRPLGVFLFLGPSGTGKTEIAKTMAQCIYGSQEKLIFLEMGQFGEHHDKSMFIGAAPGYIGYGEGQLTNGLRDKPQSVVLFDEVEKADRAIFDVLLRFLDEGVIQDPAGPMRDGRKCVVVLTSNLMLDDVVDFGRPSPGVASGDRPSLRDLYALDPHQRAARIREALGKVQVNRRGTPGATPERFFRPEFINRIDQIVLFDYLRKGTFVEIVEARLRHEAARFRDEMSIEFTWDESMVHLLAARCDVRAEEGARVVDKVIDTDVLSPLIDFCVAAGELRPRRLKLRDTQGRTEVLVG